MDPNSALKCPTSRCGGGGGHLPPVWEIYITPEIYGGGFSLYQFIL
jgi:hypothetical protein